MTLDLALAFVVALMAWLGWRAGLMRQGIRLAAVVVAFVGCVPASEPLLAAAHDKWGWEGGAAEVAAIGAAALLLFGLAWIALRIAVGALRRSSKVLSASDRAAGLALGAVKGAIVAWVIASLVGLAAAPIGALDPRDRLGLRGGYTEAIVARYDVLAPWRYPAAARLMRAVRVAHRASRSRRAARIVRADERAAELLRDDALKALLEREEAVEAALSERIGALLAIRQARSLLRDEAFREKLGAIDWEALEESILAETEPPAS